MPTTAWILVALATLLAGAFGGFSYCKNTLEKKIGRADNYAKELLNDATRKAEEKKKETILEAKEEVLRLKGELDREINDRRAEQKRAENRIAQREETLDKKLDNLEKREELMNIKAEEITKRLKEAEALRDKQAGELEPLGGGELVAFEQQPRGRRASGPGEVGRDLVGAAHRHGGEAGEAVGEVGGAAVEEERRPLRGEVAPAGEDGSRGVEEVGVQGEQQGVGAGGARRGAEFFVAPRKVGEQGRGQSGHGGGGTPGVWCAGCVRECARRGRRVRCARSWSASHGRAGRAP